MLTTVYRVEDVAGYGPYQGYLGKECDWHGDMVMAHSNKKSHPTPSMDGIWFDTLRWESYRHGFANKAKMEEWFGDFLPMMIESGFRIVLYWVLREDVLEGSKQVVFYPRGVQSKDIL